MSHHDEKKQWITKSAQKEACNCAQIAELLYEPHSRDAEAPDKDVAWGCVAVKDGLFIGIYCHAGSEPQSIHSSLQHCPMPDASEEEIRTFHGQIRVICLLNAFYLEKERNAPPQKVETI